MGFYFPFQGLWRECLATTARLTVRFAKTLNCGFKTFLNMDSSPRNDQTS